MVPVVGFLAPMRPAVVFYPTRPSLRKKYLWAWPFVYENLRVGLKGLNFILWQVYVIFNGGPEILKHRVPAHMDI